MTEELKPCPFCGSELISVGWTYDRTVIGDKVILSCYYTVVCECGASMFIRMKNRDDSDEDEDLPTIKEAARIATERWNKRAMEIHQD